MQISSLANINFWSLSFSHHSCPYDSCATKNKCENSGLCQTNHSGPTMLSPRNCWVVRSGTTLLCDSGRDWAEDLKPLTSHQRTTDLAGATHTVLTDEMDGGKGRAPQREWARRPDPWAESRLGDCSNLPHRNSVSRLPNENGNTTRTKDWEAAVRPHVAYTGVTGLANSHGGLI